MSLPTEQHFILKEDGKIYWIEKMPENQILTHDSNYLYKQELQSAIDSAVEVSNWDERNNFMLNGWQPLEVGKVYTLLCSVEKKQDMYAYAYDPYNTKFVALVTFSKPEQKELLSDLMKTDQEYGMYDQPEEKETQEDLWAEVFQELPSWETVKKKFTITRKEK